MLSITDFQENKKRWLDHISRLDDSNLIKEVIHYKSSGWRDVTRLPNTWLKWNSEQATNLNFEVKKKTINELSEKLLSPLPYLSFHNCHKEIDTCFFLDFGKWDACYLSLDRIVGRLRIPHPPGWNFLW